MMPSDWHTFISLDEDHDICSWYQESASGAGNFITAQYTAAMKSSHCHREAARRADYFELSSVLNRLIRAWAAAPISHRS